MSHRFVCLLFAFLILLSCTDDKKREIENARDLKKKEAVFSSINSAWNFNTGPANPTSAKLFSSWNEWRILLNELGQKPKSTIGAFRNKAKTLSLKAKDLDKTIPHQFGRPEIKSRIAVLQTKINALNLFINLDDIPSQKVLAMIADINTELSALQMQMAEIVRRSEIPKEEGEADMLRMLDTARAIPSTPKEIPVATPASMLDQRHKMMEKAKRMKQNH
jgi:hypothetical protein